MLFFDLEKVMQKKYFWPLLNMCCPFRYMKELQEILGVSRPTVYNLLKKKEFRWIQLDGGKYRISKKSFDDWLDKLEE